jgi:O-antigen/teichoic acid export membrane protein
LKGIRIFQTGQSLRPVFLTSAAGSVSFAVQILASIVLMPFLLPHLGMSGLGLWLMSVSLMGLTSVLSVALSGGVVTALSQTADREDEARDQITGAALAASLMATGVITALMLPLVTLLDWHGALSPGPNLTPEDTQRSIPGLALVVSLTVLLQLPKSMLLGLSRGYIGHMAELLGSVLATLLVVLAIERGEPIWVLILLFGLTRLLCVFAIGSLALFQMGLRPWTPDFTQLKTAQWIWRQGGQLGVSQVASSAINPADILLIGLVLGAASNAAFGAVQQIMLLPSFFTMIIGASFWPVFARDYAEGHLHALRITLRNALLLGLICTAIYGAIAGLIMDRILLFWLREEIAIPALVVPALACWAVMSSGIAISVIVLRAMGETRFLMVTMVAALALKVLLTLILLQRFGPAGATMATLLATFALVVIPTFLRVSARLR